MYWGTCMYILHMYGCSTESVLCVHCSIPNSVQIQSNEHLIVVVRHRIIGANLGGVTNFGETPQQF